MTTLLRRWTELLVRRTAARWPAALQERLLEEWLAELDQLGVARRLWFAVPLWLGRSPEPEPSTANGAVSRSELILALRIITAMAWTMTLVLRMALIIAPILPWLPGLIRIDIARRWGLVIEKKLDTPDA